MGWASANPIFDNVAYALVESKIDTRITTRVLTILIDELCDGDWDTLDESYNEFTEYPEVLQAFHDCQRGYEPWDEEDEDTE